MKNIVTITVITLLSLYSNITAASLIGDTVYAQQGYDNGFGLTYINAPIAVGPATADNSDETMINSAPSYPHTLDLNSDGFRLYQTSTGWASGFNFNGYILTDFDYGNNQVISGFDLSTNIFDFNDSRVSFTDDAVLLDFTGLSVNYGYVDIDLQFSAVPLPPTLILLLSGIGILSVFSKKTE